MPSPDRKDATVKAWLTQIQMMWRDWTTPQKVAISGAAFLCVAAVIGVGLWSMQSQYVPVASDLSPATAAEIVAALESKGIQSQLNFSGSSVLVPKQDLSRARLAAGDLLDINHGGKEDLEGSIWGDPALTHQRMLRAQEQRIARSITQMQFVRQATVHLSKPEPSPFVRDRVPPSASVVLELKGTNPISREDAQAIVALVSHGVEGMAPEQVTVMDTQGRILTSREPVEGDVAAHLEYRRRLEADLAIKAETLLSQMLGAGKAMVRVTADVDFTERQIEKKTYDPDGKVKVQEKIESQSEPSVAARSAPSGGAGGNVTPGASSTASGAGRAESQSGARRLMQTRKRRKRTGKRPGA